MRIPVAQQREIARLHFHQPQSARSISRITSVCANSVGEMRKLILASGKNWPDIVDLDDDQWELALGTQNRSIAQRKVSPDWAWVLSRCGWRMRPGNRFGRNGGKNTRTASANLSSTKVTESGWDSNGS